MSGLEAILTIDLTPSPDLTIDITYDKNELEAECKRTGVARTGNAKEENAILQLVKNFHRRKLQRMMEEDRPSLIGSLLDRPVSPTPAAAPAPAATGISQFIMAPSDGRGLFEANAEPDGTTGWEVVGKEAEIDGEPLEDDDLDGSPLSDSDDDGPVGPIQFDLNVEG